MVSKSNYLFSHGRFPHAEGTRLPSFFSHAENQSFLAAYIGQNKQDRAYFAGSGRNLSSSHCQIRILKKTHFPQHLSPGSILNNSMITWFPNKKKSWQPAGNSLLSTYGWDPVLGKPLVVPEKEMSSSWFSSTQALNPVSPESFQFFSYLLQSTRQAVTCSLTKAEGQKSI